MSDRSRVSTRLKHLVESSICPAENAEDYKDELKELARRIASARWAKSRSKFFKALGDETRLKILKLLGVREMCVCEVMVALNTTQPTTSHHLNILENAGLVQSRKVGRWAYYSLADPEIVENMEKVDLL